jgi:kynureninase|tara:strand:+ start:374 stop:1639 length:1266 start_codon:yes stop_codon:yes gene_type:complete
MNLHSIALENDKNDSLSNFKKRFFNNENEIYLDGNSLGKLPLETISELNNTIKNQWGKKLIRSWNEHWLDLNDRVNLKMSKLINADPNEVLVGESTSVNLYKLLYGLLNSKKYEKRLLTDSLNFPSDLYIMEGLKEFTKSKKVQVVKYISDLESDLKLLKESIKHSPGVICLSLVTYKSSWLYPMLELNEFAKKNKSIIVWDCSHAIGVVDIDVKKTKTKIALGCTYKFLNGGPGSPSFIYINNKLIKDISNPIQGWFGHEKPFNFSDNYKPFDGIKKFEAGTPSVISLSAIENGIDITLEAGIKNIRSKSENLGDFLISLIKTELEVLGFEITSPLNSINRGSHISIKHKEAWRICKLLIKGKANRKTIIPDFRPNNTIRFGLAPLYVSYMDLFESIERIKEIVNTKEFLLIDDSKESVT